MGDGAGDSGAWSVQLCGGCRDPNQNGHEEQKGLQGRLKKRTGEVRVAVFEEFTTIKGEGTKRW